MSSVSSPRLQPLVELVRPQDHQHVVWVVRAAAALGLLLGCSGVLSELLFTQQSLGKWAVTVVGPAVVLGLTLSRRPVTYLAAAVIALLPFLQVAVSFKGQSFPVAAVVIVAGVVVAFLVEGGSASGATRPTSPLKFAALAMVVLLLPAALRGATPWQWLLQVVVVIAVGYVVSRAWALDPDAGALVFPVFAGMLALQGLLALHEFRVGRPLSFYGGQSAYGSSYFFNYGDTFRPSGSFYDPISLGNVLALGVPLLLALATDTRSGLIRRVWYAACGIVAAGALVLTLSRMSWIGAAVGVVVVLVLSPAADRVRQVVFLAAASVVVATTAVALAGANLTQRFSSIFDPTATGVRTAEGDETRQQLWRVAFEVFSGHPVFGVGQGGLNYFLVQHVAGAGPFTHAHSTYLQILGETGVLGGIGVVAMLLVAARVLFWTVGSRGTHSAMVRGCAGALVAVLVVWSTDYTVRFTGVLLCMALPLVFLHATRSAGATAGVRPAAAPRSAAEGPDRGRTVDA